MSIFSKGCKPDNFESHNSLKLSFTNICGLHSILLNLNLSHNQSHLTFWLFEKNLDDSTDSGNFSVKGYLPLIQRDSLTHMHGLAVYVKGRLPFAWDLSLENFMDSYLCFRLVYFTQCLTSFSFIDHILHF